MKRDHLLNCLCGGILALVAGFCAAMCVASGFSLEVDWQNILLWCALGSALCGISLYFKHGWAAVLAGVVLALWLCRDSIPESLSGLVYEMTRRYDSAYGVGIAGSPADTTAALAAVGTWVALTVGWTVCCRTPVTPAALVCVTPLLLCVVVTDTVPETIWLAGLLFTLLELIASNPLRQKHPGQGAALAAYLAAPLILGLLLLFALVPREGYDHRPTQLRAFLASAAEDFPGAVRELAHQVSGTAREDSVDLTAVGPQSLPTTPVADVVAARTGVIYLREQDYDYYTGTGWTSSPERQEEIELNPDISWEEMGEVTVSTRRSRELLLLPYYNEASGVLAGGALENTDGLSAYTVTQYDLPKDWEMAATVYYYPPPAVDSETSGNGDRYLQLPEESREALEARVGQILTGEQSATDKALAIADYVENSAMYSLNTPYMPDGEDDFALWFLESSDTGYCVHFATATTVLLRAAGVESRYVTGYSVYAFAGQVTTVTAAEAHAWVEYYEPRLGIWIPLEATPADLSPEEETEATTPPPSTESPTSLPTEGETAEVTQPPAEKPAEEPEAKRSYVWLLWLLPLAILGFFPLRRQILRKRRRPKGGPNQTALALWQQIEATDQALGRTPPAQLRALAEKACYSHHTLTAAELEIFTEYLLDGQSLCRGKPWYRRLKWRYWDAIL